MDREGKGEGKNNLHSGLQSSLIRLWLDQRVIRPGLRLRLWLTDALATSHLPRTANTPSVPRRQRQPSNRVRCPPRRLPWLLLGSNERSL
jgi:hypothetical protein